MNIKIFEFFLAFMVSFPKWNTGTVGLPHHSAPCMKWNRDQKEIDNHAHVFFFLMASLIKRKQADIIKT